MMDFDFPSVKEVEGIKVVTIGGNKLVGEIYSCLKECGFNTSKTIKFVFQDFGNAIHCSQIIDENT